VTLKSGLQVTEGHSNLYHRKLVCGFLLAFHSNYGHNLVMFLHYLALHKNGKLRCLLISGVSDSEKNRFWSVLSDYI